MEKQAELNRTKQCNPTHNPSVPGHQTGYQGDTSEATLSNKSKQGSSDIVSKGETDKQAQLNRTNQCNPTHTPSGPGHKAGYQGDTSEATLNNKSKQGSSDIVSKGETDKQAQLNRTNQCNPTHTPSGPGHKAGYPGDTAKTTLDNKSKQGHK